MWKQSNYLSELQSIFHFRGNITCFEVFTLRKLDFLNVMLVQYSNLNRFFQSRKKKGEDNLLSLSSAETKNTWLTIIENKINAIWSIFFKKRRYNTKKKSLVESRGMQLMEKTNLSLSLSCYIHVFLLCSIRVQRIP